MTSSGLIADTLANFWNLHLTEFSMLLSLFNPFISSASAQSHHEYLCSDAFPKRRF